MTTLHFMKTAPALAAICLTVLSTTSAFAHGPADSGGRGQEKVTPLQQQSLKDVPGKQLQMVTVDYAPGQASVPHVHPGSVVAYVLEGEVVSKLAGGAEVRYRAGESWYEPPGVPHLVSRNGSSRKPARLLAVLITGENEPVKRDLTDEK